MQATKTLKRETKWQAMWRRANRRTPFWKRRPAEGSETPQESFVFGALVDFIGVLAPMFFGVLTILVIIQVLVAPIFLSPDLLTVGLADPIGRGLAAVCLATGNCNLPYLLGGVIVGVLLLVLMVLTIGTLSQAEVVDDNDTIATVLQAKAELYELVVHLRADLVLAGVLKVTPEEVVEQAQADGLAVCETCGVVGGGHRADCPEGAEA